MGTIVDWLTGRRMAVLLLAVLAAACGWKPASLHAVEAPKHILILNSYHQGFAWTDNQMEGILDSLRSSGIEYHVHIEYMDWKRYATGEYLAFFTEGLRYKYSDDSHPVDLVITTDDAALSFAMENRRSIFHQAPVVFSGINRLSLPDIVKETSGVAGVLEEVDPTETVRLAQQLNPALTDVYVVFDNSESGLSTGALVQHKVRAMGFTPIPLNGLTFEQLLDLVGTAGADSVVLMTTYFSDITGKALDYGEAARAISRASRVPVYHLYDYGLNNGAFGGSMLSGKLQGEAAAGLAVRMLKGEDLSGLFLPSPETVRTVFDYEQLKRFNVPLNQVPKSSEIINRPFSFYESYRHLVQGIAAAFAVLLLFIALLITYISRIRRMERKLMANNQELNRLYEELAASEEELRAQFEEISDIKEVLACSEEKFRLAANGSQAVIWDVDLLTNRYFYSDSWYDLLGYERHEIGEETGGWRRIVHPEDMAAVQQAEMRHMTSASPFFDCEIRLRAKNGQYIWFQAKGKGLQDASGRFVRFAGSLIDITERKEYELKLQCSYQELETTYEELAATQEELQDNYNALVDNQNELHRLAYYDTLTGLPNRVSFLFELARFIELDGGTALILYLDIDNFQYINDSMGHSAGDRLIRKVAERLAGLVTERDKLFRLGGDEFIILFMNPRGETTDCADAILEGFREPIRDEDMDAYVSVSIGISRFPGDGHNADELLKNADIAMHQAKEADKGKYSVFTPAMDSSIQERMVIEKNLRGALRQKEFVLYYQPQLDLKSGRVTGFEALIRWNSPQLGFVSPLTFIRVAEDCRLIGPIGEWVLRQACSFIKTVHAQGYPDCGISVNISVMQLIRDDFVSRVLDLLDEAGLAPGMLELEITESVFMESYDKVVGKLNQLASRGVHIALDDFGTGYSSLSYLMRLPIDTLKIDKSFIQPAPGMGNRESLSDSIIMIGHRLGLRVVAEGVETEEQLHRLRESGCDQIQGYLISRPIPEAEVLRFLQQFPASPKL